MVKVSAAWIVLLMVLLMPLGVAGVVNLNYPYYAARGGTAAVYAQCVNGSVQVNDSSGVASFEYSGGSPVNMSWNGRDWYVGLVMDGSADEDVYFNVSCLWNESYWDNSSNVTVNNWTECCRSGGLIKGRVPFNVTVSLYYRQGLNRSVKITNYDVVYFKFYDNRLHKMADLTWLDDVFGFLPYYQKGELTRVYDTAPAFWAWLSDGSGTVTLYEPGNYSVYYESFRRSHGWDFPFFKPQGDFVKVDSMIVRDTYVANESAAMDVYVDLTDVYKFITLQSLLAFLLFGVLWVVGGVVVYRVFGVKVLVGYAVVTLPLLLGVLGVNFLVHF